MLIYIDTDNKCHTSDDGTMRSFETELISQYFANKCVEFIEGHIYVPKSEVWENADGRKFQGEMITPWKDSRIIAAAQAQYESLLPQLTEMQTALDIFTGSNL